MELLVYMGVCMELRIEPYHARHLAAVIQLSLRAWTPVFASLQQVLNADVYQTFYPTGWQASQQRAVEEVCTDDGTQVWVAVDAGAPVGFVAVKLHATDRLGEIYMIAVDPAVQGHGIGSALIDVACAWMKETGMSIAMIDTGGDPGHAPARHTYAKAGFELLPVARFFKQL